jgi:hypothetical protein
MPQVAFSFSSRPRLARENIVLPQTAPAEPGFQTNTADLHAPKAPPRPWPAFRPPGDVDRIPALTREPRARV